MTVYLIFVKRSQTSTLIDARGASLTSAVASNYRHLDSVERIGGGHAYPLGTLAYDTERKLWFRCEQGSVVNATVNSGFAATLIEMASFQRRRTESTVETEDPGIVDRSRGSALLPGYIRLQGEGLEDLTDEWEDSPFYEKGVVHIGPYLNNAADAQVFGDTLKRVRALVTANPGLSYSVVSAGEFERGEATSSIILSGVLSEAHADRGDEDLNERETREDVFQSFDQLLAALSGADDE